MNYVCGVFNFAFSRWSRNSPNKSLANINEFIVCNLWLHNLIIYEFESNYLNEYVHHKCILKETKERVKKNEKQ